MAGLERRESHLAHAVTDVAVSASSDHVLVEAFAVDSGPFAGLAGEVALRATPTGRSTVRVFYEQRELALESLLEFCREPALMVDLYINYDCDPQCTNLFETLCLSLTKNSTPYSDIIGTVGGKPLETAVVQAQAQGGDVGLGVGGGGPSSQHLFGSEGVDGLNDEGAAERPAHDSGDELNLEHGACGLGEEQPRQPAGDEKLEGSADADQEAEAAVGEAGAEGVTRVAIVGADLVA